MAASALPYVRAFDGVRAVAVLLVMLSHWPLGHWQLPAGWVGVPVFFVLSGFLITRLLAADRSQPLGAFLRRFYGRRTLRIFPLYYFYLAVVFAALAWYGLGSIATRDAPWLLTYLYNWRELPYGWRGMVAPPAGRLVNHLWSLSVEEQFYLLFPLVVWALPPARLRRVLVGFVLAGPIVRLGAGEWLRITPGGPAVWTTFLSNATPFHLDALALGGWLALRTSTPLRHPGRWLAGSLVFGALGSLAIAGATHATLGRAWPSGRWLLFPQPTPLYTQLAHGAFVLRTAWAWVPTVVGCAATVLLVWAQRASRVAQRLLSNRPVRYVGRISYGVYIWHMPLSLLVLTPAVTAWVGVSWLRETLAISAYLTLTLAAATASYYGLERPFLRLKDRWFGAERLLSDPSPETAPKKS